MDSKRLFHGRGGLNAKLAADLAVGLENVVFDSFPPTLFITLYKETDITSLKHFLALPYENILIQKRYTERPELELVKGTLPENPYAFELGCRYHLKFGTSQNIGFFLDMKSGREWLMNNAKDKRVLNLFAYTCSLSVAALKGGAVMVVNVDMAKGALATGKENHKLNGIEAHKAKFLSYDILKSWNNISRSGPYDVVVIDPPTNQGDSFKVERDYYKIIKRLNNMTNPGAIVIACLNSPYLKSDFLKQIFAEQAPEFSFSTKLDSSFADMEVEPEEGLKILLFHKH